MNYKLEGGENKIKERKYQAQVELSCYILQYSIVTNWQKKEGSLCTGLNSKLRFFCIH